MHAECDPNDLEHCCGDCLYEIAKAQRAKIERLQLIMDKLQQTANTGILPDGDHVNLPTKMWLADLDMLLNVAVEKP